MADQVERFARTGFDPPDSDGQWVRYSDYEKLEAELDLIARLLALAAPAIRKARSTGQPGLDAALMTVMDAIDIAALDSEARNGRGAGERGSPPEVSELSADNVKRERDESIQARREIESKLASGYSLCHPEDDCEGKRAWMKAAAERDELLEAATKRSLVGHPELKTVVDRIQASRRPGGEPRQGGEQRG
jgi:hypothetical protein